MFNPKDETKDGLVARHRQRSRKWIKAFAEIEKKRSLRSVRIADRQRQLAERQN
jgi:hypothetical protein